MDAKEAAENAHEQIMEHYCAPGNFDGAKVLRIIQSAIDSALAAQVARIKELEAEIARLKNVQSLFAAIGMKDARIAELEAALQLLYDNFHVIHDSKRAERERALAAAGKALKGKE